MAARLKKIKSRAEQEPRSAHGRAVNKSRVKQEPRSAHGRAVNNKSRVKQEPRSAHGRAVNNNKNNKSRAKQEPRSAHGRAVKNIRKEMQRPFCSYVRGEPISTLKVFGSPAEAHPYKKCFSTTPPPPPFIHVGRGAVRTGALIY